MYLVCFISRIPKKLKCLDQRKLEIHIESKETFFHFIKTDVCIIMDNLCLCAIPSSIKSHFHDLSSRTLNIKLRHTITSDKEVPQM